MNACITWAFDIQEPQIIGPNWLNDVSFDIFAKASGPAAEAELRNMLQALLSDRFKLTFHRETREIPALTLLVSSKVTSSRRQKNPAPPASAPVK
jgi:uncharacterized protein (TIGR03435 family)